MRKLTVLTGASLLMLLSGGMARASERPVCEIAQRLEAQNPAAAAAGKVRGIVKSVVGDVVTLQEPNGKVSRVTLTKRERGDMGHLIGRDVVVSPVYCERITLAPPPAPRIAPVRPLSLPSTSAPASTPVPPRPRPTPVAPAPAPLPAPVPVAPQAPVIIPQTW